MQAELKEKYCLTTNDYDEAMKFLDEHTVMLVDAGFVICGVSFLTFEDDEGLKAYEAYVEATRDYEKE